MAHLKYLPIYVLHLISFFLYPPDVINLMLSCQEFSAKFDDDDVVWRSRSSLGAKIKLKPVGNVAISRHSTLFGSMSNRKRNVLARWVFEIHQNAVSGRTTFRELYKAALYNDLRQRTAELLHTSIAQGVLVGNIDQCVCAHGRLLFKLLTSSFQ